MSVEDDIEGIRAQVQDELRLVVAALVKATVATLQRDARSAAAAVHLARRILSKVARSVAVLDLVDERPP